MIPLKSSARLLFVEIIRCLVNDFRGLEFLKCNMIAEKPVDRLAKWFISVLPRNYRINFLE